MALLDLIRLGWWLGPKADAPAPAVEQRTITIDPAAPGDRPLTALTFAPRGREPDGALLLIPGLHPDGPTDARMMRFASVLAHGGVYVLSPTLPDLAALKLAPTLMPDARRAFVALEERAPAGIKPGVMSISFGSLPALQFAGHPDFRERIGGVMTFGGYARWQAALRFALAGGQGVPFDPLNRPAGYMQLLDGLPLVDRPPPVDRPRLEAAWLGFVGETWGRPEMKRDGAWQPVAERWARAAHPDDQPLARLGLGLDPRCVAVAEEIVARYLADGTVDFLDPRPAIPHIAAPLYIVHGVDDDVIPVGQADELAAATGPEQAVKVLVTGAYGHTGRADNMLREARSMIGILRALRAIATRRGRGG